MASKLVTSSAARNVYPQGMKYLMTWLSSSAKPRDKQQREIDEHIAQLGLNQENMMRMQSHQPLFEYATIMTGIHFSSQKQRNADPDPHVTLRVATSEMRRSHRSVVLHARVQSQSEPIYIGSETYPDPTPDGDTQRKSYLNPDHKAKYNQVRSSLFYEGDSDSTVVGCVVSYEQRKWYVVDSAGELVFLPEGGDGKFFSAGLGKDEHLRFWDPVKKKTCRAVFLGIERPAASSPQQSTLDTNYSDLAGAFSDFSLEDSVQDKGKNVKVAWETPSVSSTSPGDSASMVAGGEAWSGWVWNRSINTYERSCQKGTWEYDSASQPTSDGYTVQSTAAEISGAVAGLAESCCPAAFQSHLCYYVQILSKSENKYRCSLSDGGDIQLRADNWVQSTIDYNGSVVPCWTYTGKSGTVYYHGQSI